MQILDWLRKNTRSLLREAWLVSLISLVAFGLRIYRLSAQPLWLDEIYSIELVREGPIAILRNSLSDPHPLPDAWPRLALPARWLFLPGIFIIARRDAHLPS